MLDWISHPSTKIFQAYLPGGGVNLKNVDLAKKLPAVTAVLRVVIFAIAGSLFIRYVPDRMAVSEAEHLRRDVSLVVEGISAFNAHVEEHTKTTGKVLAAEFALTFEIDPRERIDAWGAPMPALRNAGHTINNDPQPFDRLLATTGVVSSAVVVADGDLVRVMSSVRNVERIARMSEESVAALGQLSSAVDELNRTAAGLRDQVGRFRT